MSGIFMMMLMVAAPPLPAVPMTGLNGDFGYLITPNDLAVLHLTQQQAEGYL